MSASKSSCSSTVRTEPGIGGSAGKGVWRAPKTMPVWISSGSSRTSGVVTAISPGRC